MFPTISKIFNSPNKINQASFKTTLYKTKNLFFTIQERNFFQSEGMNFLDSSYNEKIDNNYDM